MVFSEIYDNVVLVLQASILVLAALFPIVNPIGSAAVFLSLVENVSPELQRKLVNRITMYSFFLLFGSMLLGGKILSFFGISLYAVQIGGGLIVAITGWQLLTKDAQKVSQTAPNPEEILARAFYPYTLPITVRAYGSISPSPWRWARTCPANCKRSPSSPPTSWPPRSSRHALVTCAVVYILLPLGARRSAAAG